MKAAHHIGRHNSGAVMVFALLLLIVGAMVLAGVAQKAATQGVSANVELELSERRVLLRNSQALARQFVLSKMFFGSMPNPPGSPGALYVAGFTNAELGGFSVTNTEASLDFWETTSSSNSAVNINPFSPLERGGFYRVVLPSSLYGGQTSSGNLPVRVAWNFLVRTRSPIAAGYSLVLQKPSDVPSSAVTYENHPYVDFIGAAPGFYGFPGIPQIPVSSVTNTARDATGYQGYLGVPVSMTRAETFPGVTNIPTGNPPDSFTVQIQLTNASMPADLNTKAFECKVPASLPDPTNAAIQLPVTRVELVGAPASTGLLPLQVLMTNCPSVDQIVLDGANARSIYLNFHSAALRDYPVVVEMTDATSWRIGMTMLQTPVLLYAPGLVVVRGGVRTDRGVEVESAALRVEPDPDPGNLDFIADRMMWLEDNQSLQE